MHAGGRGDVQLVQLAGGQFGQALGGGEEPLDLVLGHEAGGEGAELVDVLLAGERPGAERVGVGDGDLVGDDGAVGQGDLDGAAEGLLGDVQGVVAAGPLRVLDRGDLVPQLHGVRPGGAFRGVGVHVVPGAVLQGDGEDVRDRVVQRLAAGRGVVLLRVVRAGADHVVGVVAGLDQHRLHVGGVGDLGVLAVELAGQVDPGLGLVLGRVLLGVGVQDGALGLAGRRAAAPCRRRPGRRASRR